MDSREIPPSVVAMTWDVPHHKPAGENISHFSLSPHTSHLHSSHITQITYKCTHVHVSLNPHTSLTSHFLPSLTPHTLPPSPFTYSPPPPHLLSLSPVVSFDINRPIKLTLTSQLIQRLSEFSSTILKAVHSDDRNDTATTPHSEEHVDIPHTQPDLTSGANAQRTLTVTESVELSSRDASGKETIREVENGVMKSIDGVGVADVSSFQVKASAVQVLVEFQLSSRVLDTSAADERESFMSLVEEEGGASQVRSVSVAEEGLVLMWEHVTLAYPNVTNSGGFVVRSVQLRVSLSVPSVFVHTLAFLSSFPCLSLHLSSIPFSLSLSFTLSPLLSPPSFPFSLPLLPSLPPSLHLSIHPSIHLSLPPPFPPLHTGSTKPTCVSGDIHITGLQALTITDCTTSPVILPTQLNCFFLQHIPTSSLDLYVHVHILYMWDRLKTAGPF